MADLDDISVMIGELRADVKNILRWTSAHEQADERRFQVLSDRIESQTGVALRIDALEVKTADSEEVVEQVKRAVTFSRGFLLAISLIGGVFGAAALQLSKWL